jgi:hypothetical protein
MLKNQLIFISLVFCFTTQIVSQNIYGYYSNPELDIGFFRTKIALYDDSTFYYQFSGDMINDQSIGTYSVKEKILYLNYDEISDSISSNRVYVLEHIGDSTIFHETNDFSTYNPTGDRNTEWLIGRKKLIPRNLETGKFIRKAKLLKIDKDEWERMYGVSIRYLPATSGQKEINPK